MRTGVVLGRKGRGVSMTKDVITRVIISQVVQAIRRTF